MEFSTKMDSCQWKLKFQSIVDHSKIMYCCSSVQIEIVSMNEIVFLLCQKEPTALKYLLIKHQNSRKENGSKCTNDNPTWTTSWCCMFTRTEPRENELILILSLDRTDFLTLVDVANDFVGEKENRKQLFGKFSVNDIPNKFSISSKSTQTEN